MRRFFCAVVFTLCAASAFAQVQVVGTWEGTAAIVGCVGEPPGGTGPAALHVAQAGSVVFGTLVLPSDCGPIAIAFIGELSSNGITGTALLPFADTDPTFTAVVSGNTITVMAADLNVSPLTRTSSQPPDTRLTGGSSGSGTFTDICTNGSFTVSFTITGALIHANAISGILVVEGTRDFEEDPSGACMFVDEPFAEPILFSASISGNNFSGVILFPDQGGQDQEVDDVIPITGSISGSTLSGSAMGERGESLIFAITQTPGLIPPAIISFTATPSSIGPGQSSTLAWTTINADSVTIDNGIGTRPASGSAVVSPAVTTTYTLTATGPGGTATATTTVMVTGAEPARVAVTSSPNGMVQAAGVATASDRFTVTNLGGTSTNITLTQNGNFFTQTPTSFALAPGDSQVVFIRATAQQGTGTFQGTSIVTGSGSAAITVPIQLAVAAPPAAPVAPSAVNTRPDVTAPADQNPTGSVDFTNTGAGVLQGSAVADQPWLIPQSGLISIAPGETRTISFTSNRSLRPDGDAPVGGQTGKLSINYLDFPGATAGFSASQTSSGSSNTNVISVSIVDVIKPGVVPGTPPPLAAGELAVFAPGLPQRANSLGDLLLGATGTSSIADLRLFFTGPGASPLSTTLGQVIPGSGISLPSVLKNVFSTPASTGTVQIRSASTDRVSVAAVVTNTASRVGSFITALPTFRSDNAVAPGSVSVLAGVEKGTVLAGSTRVTNVFVQEVSGNSATVQIDFLGERGNVIASRPADSISGFGLLELNDVVPPGAVVARVSNTSASPARIVAHALVVDSGTQDAWLISDSAVGATTNNVFVPVIPGPPGADTFTDLFIVNPGTAPLTITVETVSSGGRRRRAVRPSSGNSLRLESDGATNVVFGPGEMINVQIVSITSGFVRLSAPSRFSVSGRSTLFVPGRPGTFGSALPVLTSDAALASGQPRRFAGVDDSAQRTVAARTPVTYRSSLGLMEASGQAAVVRATLRYTFSAGTRTTAQGVSSRDFPIAANQLLVVGRLSEAIIGPRRETFGDLRNMQLDVEVVSGNGTVIPFLQVIDNGSQDTSIRSE